MNSLKNFILQSFLQIFCSVMYGRRRPRELREELKGKKVNKNDGKDLGEIKEVEGS